MIVTYKNAKGQERHTASMTSEYCDLYAERMKEMGMTNIRKGD